MSYKKHLFFITLSILIPLAFQNSGFFWDNVTFGYKMGNHLFYNGLFNFHFPNEFDPGHPPFLAFILASSWKLFGKNLLVSHIALTPFIYGFFVQLFLFCKQFTKSKRQSYFAFLLVVLDPTISAQLVLISPEVIQVFFFLLVVNNLHKNYILKTLGLFFLAIVTYRSMMLFAGIFLYEVVHHLWLSRHNLPSFFSKKTILCYGFGAIPAFSYIFFRLSGKGWLQTHPDSPWESLWHFASFGEFLKNCIVLVHRYLDFGRIAIFIVLIGLLLFQRKIFLDKKNKKLLLLAFSSVFFVASISLVAINPFGHRYFIVSYLIFALVAFRGLSLLPRKRKKLVYGLLIASLVSGNLWVYPREISQGWDASLAHVPYFELRQKAIQYLDENNIPIHKTGTFFPNGGKIDKIDLSNDSRAFLNFKAEEPYVFYSNVYNLSDGEISLIDANYKTIKVFRSGTVKIEILQHKLKKPSQ
jgi:hypothetical protein